MNNRVSSAITTTGILDRERDVCRYHSIPEGAVSQSRTVVVKRRQESSHSLLPLALPHNILGNLHLLCLKLQRYPCCYAQATLDRSH
jgi:hypothetical protein